MDRRANIRLDLELSCRLGARRIYSISPTAITENVSRNGILMRWPDTEPLPETGSKLLVEIELPVNTGFGRRTMRCHTTVVRIDRSGDRHSSVALRVNKMAFAGASRARLADLKSMPVSTGTVN